MHDRIDILYNIYEQCEIRRYYHNKTILTYDNFLKAQVHANAFWILVQHPCHIIPYAFK